MFKLKEYAKSDYWSFALTISNPHEYYESGHCRTNYCNLHFALFGHSWWFCIPELFKPRKKWVDTSKYEWSNNPAGGYWDYIKREYGISVSEDTIHLAYGIQPGGWHSNDKKNSDHTKVFWIPWKQRRRECILFMNDDGGVHSVYKDKPNGSIDFDSLRKHEEDAPKYKFRFNDFDGEEIEAVCTIQKSIYTKGDGWCRWLKWFTKKEIYKKLDIEFSKETGYEKGSWKGGTTGHSIEMKPSEGALDAFERYGRQQDRYKNHGVKYRGFTNIREVE